MDDHTQKMMIFIFSSRPGTAVFQKKSEKRTGEHKQRTVRDGFAHFHHVPGPERTSRPRRLLLQWRTISAIVHRRHMYGYYYKSTYCC